MNNYETSRVENKEKLNEDFEQEVIAFLNYKEGGAIYVGINKSGQPVEIDDIDQVQLQIKDRIKHNIQPSTLGLFDVVVETIDNKELIRVFKDVELIENIGSGVLRILDAYDKSCFKFMEHFLRVSFKYKENPFEYDTKNKVSANDTLNDTLKDTIRLTKNEQQILSLIVNNNQITREEIVNKTRLSDRTISRAIKHLQDKKIISREGSKKTGYWKILK